MIVQELRIEVLYTNKEKVLFTLYIFIPFAISIYEEIRDNAV